MPFSTKRQSLGNEPSKRTMREATRMITRMEELAARIEVSNALTVVQIGEHYNQEGDEGDEPDLKGQLLKANAMLEDIHDTGIAPFVPEKDNSMYAVYALLVVNLIVTTVALLFNLGMF